MNQDARDLSRPVTEVEKSDTDPTLPQIGNDRWADKTEQFLKSWVTNNPNLSPELRDALAVKVRTEHGFWNEPDSVRGVITDPKAPGSIAVDYVEEGEILSISVKVI